MNITERQMDIIEASGRILASKGIMALTVKNLASEIGFVESALYRHFKSKEDIIVLLVKYLYNNIQNRFEPVIKEKATNKEKLEKLFKSQFVYLSENPHFVVVALSEGLIDEKDEIKNEVMKIYLYKMNVITNLFENGMEKGEWQTNLSTSDLIHFLMGGFRLLMFKWKFSHFSFDLVKEGNHMIQQFFTMITVQK
jgi:TetR/AcrR family fatty acid metabolism transcriptional regulator